MDVVHDQMADGQAFRILAVIDQWSRESVCLEANFRLSGRCVASFGPHWHAAWLAQGRYHGQRHRIHLQGPG